MSTKKKLVLLISATAILALLSLALSSWTVTSYVKNIPLINIFHQPAGDQELSTIKINDTEISAETAITSQQKTRGLSGRKSLGKDKGMLFVLGKKTYPSFWMKDMNFAIDIIWIADGKIVGIEKAVQPPKPGASDSELKLYQPPKLIDYVLEVNSGFSEKNNFDIDNSVEINL